MSDTLPRPKGADRPLDEYERQALLDRFAATQRRRYHDDEHGGEYRGCRDCILDGNVPT